MCTYYVTVAVGRCAQTTELDRLGVSPESAVKSSAWPLHLKHWLGQEGLLSNVSLTWLVVGAGCWWGLLYMTSRPGLLFSIWHLWHESLFCSGGWALRQRQKGSKLMRERSTQDRSCSFLPWLLWLSELSASLWTKGSPVWTPVRAHAWVAGQVPSRGRVRGNHTLIFPSLSFSLPSPLSNK